MTKINIVEIQDELNRLYAQINKQIKELTSYTQKLEKELNYCKECQGCIGMKEVFKNEQ